MQEPTSGEVEKFSISAFKGIEIGLGKSDPGAVMALHLAEQYPDYLVLIQAGKFLQAYDKSAHFLSTLKGYRAQLVGKSSEPHIRVGFPVSNFKRRLWSIVSEFGTPYVVALGSKAMGHTVYVSDQFQTGNSLLKCIPETIVTEVINDLIQRGEVNKSSAEKLLNTKDSSDFKLKSQAQDLDTQLMLDIINMPRDIRVTFGENVRACMARIMHGVFAYGLSDIKLTLLHTISADVDLLKHYLAQAQRLSKLKFAFEHRACLAVELGRLVGGLIRSAKAQP